MNLVLLPGQLREIGLALALMTVLVFDVAAAGTRIIASDLLGVSGRGVVRESRPDDFAVLFSATRGHGPILEQTALEPQVLHGQALVDELR